MLCKSSLQDYWSLHPVIQIPYAASIGMSWDRFLKLLTMMQRQLGCQPDYEPLFIIWPIIDTHSSQNFRTTKTRRTADYR